MGSNVVIELKSIINYDELEAIINSKANQKEVNKYYVIYDKVISYLESKQTIIYVTNSNLKFIIFFKKALASIRNKSSLPHLNKINTEIKKAIKENNEERVTFKLLRYYFKYIFSANDFENLIAFNDMLIEILSHHESYYEYLTEIKKGLKYNGNSSDANFSLDRSIRNFNYKIKLLY